MSTVFGSIFFFVFASLVECMMLGVNAMCVFCVVCADVAV